MRYATFYRLFAAVGGLLGVTVPARAQDPLVTARTLFETRVSASSATATLKREHALNMTQAATTLRSVGYQATDVVPGLRTEFTSSASSIYRALRDAGYDGRHTSDAMSRNGFVLTCIDPQGHAVPCGAFGGTPDAPVTGQLTLHPSPEGATGDKLYITGSNIPPVFIRLGSMLLTEENASSSAVIVRLPGMPVTANLTIVRKADNVSGLLQQDYRVVAPPLAWAAWSGPATTGAIEDMKRWLGGVLVTNGCMVQGPLATLAAGAFASSTGFANAVRTRLVAAGAPGAIADAWDAAFRSAFTSYTSQVVAIPALPLYPSFAAVASAKAGPIPNVPMALGAFTSLGSADMVAPALSARVKAALATVSADHAARASAVDAFANAVSATFASLLLTSQVVNLMGEGPVPTFATSGGGPVVGGTCKGTNIVVLKP